MNILSKNGLRYIPLLVLFIALSSCFAQLDLPPEQNNYILYWGNQKAGYYTYTLKPIPGGWQMFGETFMSVLAGGIPGRIRFVSSWELDQTMMPTGYTLETFSGEDLRQRIIVTIKDGTAEVIIDSTKRNLPVSEKVFLIDTSTPDGWVLLAKGIDTARDSTVKLTCLSPQLARTMPLTVTPGHIEQDAAGAMRQYFVEFGGLDTDLFIKTRGNRLIYWNPKSSGMVAKWTPELDKAEFVEGSAKVDILSKVGTTSHIPSNSDLDPAVFPEKISLKIELFPRGTTEIYVQTATQTFKGTADVKGISGEVTLKRTDFSPKGAIKMPAGPINEPHAGSLTPSANIQSDNARIVELSRSITAESEDFYQAAINICRFVSDSIETNTRTMAAKTALEALGGDAISKSRLCCALLRAAGIPSRVVGGYFLENKYWIRHHWLEVWIGEKPGWVPFDATTGEIGSFTARHLTLWLDEGDLDPSAKNSIEIISWE